MISKLRTRVAREESGFTLLELLVVIIIIGILMAIAIPSYLSFRDRANDAAAKANVRSAIPAVEAYNADNSNGYTGMTRSALLAYDSGIYATLIVGNATATSYCVRATVANKTWYKNGPAADIVSGTPPSGC